MADSPGRIPAPEIVLDILEQPNDAACGPTCLQAVYRYFGDDVPLERVIAQIEPLSTGGTLAVSLASHALDRGYSATIYTYNLTLFDPAWFRDAGVDLSERLAAQAEVKAEPRLREATQAYLGYLERGGHLAYEDLSPRLIRRWLERSIPILTGLSATYLYGSSRERGVDALVEDDLAGVPTGHFVVLCGYDPERRRVLVADPLHDNPRYASHRYWEPIYRVIGAILLGVITYDANLLILEPPSAGEDAG
jgi:hypothetical protein